MSTDISNTDDVIDSRDVIERIEELEGERQALAEDLAQAEEDLSNDDAGEPRATLEANIAAATEALKGWDDDNGEELAALQALAKQGEDYAPDWEYGETLIRDSYFVEYAEELADDIGAIDKSARWPLCHIDWEAAAASLKNDYTAVEFDGVTYWVR